MMKNNIYITKCGTIPGASRSIVLKTARKIYHSIEHSTRRTPYVRTSKKSYFKGRKIFLNLYFEHLGQKNFSDSIRRVKFFEAALDFLKNNPYPPTSKDRIGEEVQLRFVAQTLDKKLFYVQIRENARGNYFLMSTFPVE